MVEGARLESVYRGNSIEGSNPSLSAIWKLAASTPRVAPHRLYAKASTTLLLTGLREQEVCYLTWDDVILERDRESLVVRRKPGFTPKDYEEREVPIPGELAAMLRAREHNSPWVFPSAGSSLETHLLRRLKRVAARAGAADATLHKFRHTYAPRLLENGADIVTVQWLLGHSDLDTTKRYLNPDGDRKRAAVTG